MRWVFTVLADVRCFLFHTARLDRETLPGAQPEAAYRDGLVRMRCSCGRTFLDYLEKPDAPSSSS